MNAFDVMSWSLALMSASAAGAVFVLVIALGVQAFKEHWK